MRAAELVGTQQAERRVLRLTNPELQGASASNRLVANIQIVMPGEIARAHRHSAGALRLIIEGRGGYTVVNGERVPMYPGDLVLTPNWSWHDHANDTDAPMMWLDGLDTPLVRMLEAGFYEEYHQERQDLVRQSTRRSGTTRCRRCGPPCSGWLRPVAATPARGSHSETSTGLPADR
jgi:gentisate 1,2-dioxygenase